MINPSNVVTQVITDIKALGGYAALGLDDVIEINEKRSKDLKPPYIGVFADFEDEANERDSALSLISLPVKIRVWIFSADYKTAKEGFAEAWTILDVIKDAPLGLKTVSSKKITIVFDPVPIRIMSNSPDQVVLALHYNYTEYL